MLHATIEEFAAGGHPHVECYCPQSRARFGLSLCYGFGMVSSVEYFFAADIRVADEAARRQGWQPHGRTGWLKADGNEVQFICFEEQLSIIGKDVTIYFVGELSQRLERFKRRWTRLNR